MVESYGFRLLTQEEIMSKMARYLSGHTEFINDFNEGSVTRSLLESISQEMFRQNLTYAQGIMESVRSSLKHTFNQPLLEASKSYGSLLLKRKLLPPPADLIAVRPTLSSTDGFNTRISVDGWINGSEFEITTIYPPSSPTDYPNPASILNNSVFIGMSIYCGTDLVSSDTQIAEFITGTGGTGKYKLTNSLNTIGSFQSIKQFILYGTVCGPVDLKINKIDATALSPLSGPATYFWSMTTVFGSRESVATSPISAYLTASSTVELKWSRDPLAKKYYVYRSTSKYMFNSIAWEITNPSSGEYVTNTDINTNTTKRLWPGSALCYAVTSVNVTLGVVAESAGTSVLAFPTKSSCAYSWPIVQSTDSLSAVQSYQIYRSDYDYSVLPTGEINATPIIGGSLTPSTTYYYKVTALTGVAEGCPSDYYGTFTADSTYKSAYVSWSSSVGAIGYRIYRSTNASFSSAAVDFYDYYSSNTFFIDNNTQFSTGGASLPFSRLIAIYPSSQNLKLNDTTYTPSLLDCGIIGYATTTGKSRIPPFNSSAFSVSGPLDIPAGTQFSIPSTQQFYTLKASYTMPASSSSISVIVESDLYGISSNTPENTITNVVSPLYGIDTVTNPAAFINGRNHESEEEWRIRFSQTLAKLSRGTIDSISYGVLSANLTDTNGYIYESVKKSFVYEPSTNVVNVYIHNGSSVSQSSPELLAKVQSIINGYIDTSGNEIAGYKPAGIPVTAYAANIQLQSVSANIVTSSGYPLSIVSESVRREIVSYFDSLQISNGLSTPSITSVTGAEGNSSYNYKIVGFDSFGNYTYPSPVFTVDNVSSNIASPGNVITFYNSNPYVKYYDILRWTGNSWGLVATVSSTVASNTIIYTDKVVTLADYIFSTTAGSANFYSDTLISRILKINGILSVTLYVPSSFGTHQDYIEPTLGSILVLGKVLVK